MAPLCFLQAYLAESLLTVFPWLVYPLIAAGIIYVAVFVWIVKKTVEATPGPEVTGAADRDGQVDR